MSIILHVVFAIISLIVTGVTAFKPNQTRLIATYVTIFLTVGSGVLLAALDHALIMRVCTTGLTYLAIEVGAVAFSVYRLKRLQKVTVTEGGER